MFFYSTSNDKDQNQRNKLQHDVRKEIYSGLAIPEKTPIILYLHRSSGG